MVRSVFSKNLVRIRNHFEWTQEVAAQKIGIKRATLAAYEEGGAEPCIDIILSICRAYRIKEVISLLADPDFLMGKDSSDRIVWHSQVDEKYSKSSGKIRMAVDLLLEIEPVKNKVDEP